MGGQKSLALHTGIPTLRSNWKIHILVYFICQALRSHLEKHYNTAILANLEISRICCIILPAVYIYC